MCSRFSTAKRRNFTLVELLAAMAVFSVMLLVAMNLFSGAQRIWSRSEEKTNCFADARVAMEFMTARLQTMIYYDDYPFVIANRAGSSADDYYYKNIYFASVMPIENRRGKDFRGVRFYSFELGETDDDKGDLKMRIYCSGAYKKGKNFGFLFPPYGKDSDNTVCEKVSNARDKIKKAFSDNDSLEKSKELSGKMGMLLQDTVIISNVISFKVIPHEIISTSGNKSEQIAKYTADKEIVAPPYLVEFELTVMDSKEHYAKWKELSGTQKQAFEQEYSYTFKRALLLGDRRSI